MARARSVSLFSVSCIRAVTMNPRFARSFMSVVMATAQPRPIGPSRMSSGMPDIGQEDLVELAVAGDLTDRANLDARRVHVEQEVRHALVLVAGGSDRASRMQKSAICAYDDQTF